MKKYLKEAKTIPNLLSFLRILLTPLFMYWFLNGKVAWSLLLLAFMGFTDLLDGKIARRFNQVTDLGKLLDPVADKITQFAIAIVLIIKYWEHTALILLFSVYIIKEILQFIAGLLMLSWGVQPTAAVFRGKLSTAVFYCVMVLIFAFGEHGAFPNFWTMPIWMMYGLTIISIILMIFAFCAYIPDFKRGVAIRREKKRNPKQ